MSSTLCRQEITQLCRREAEWPCMGCGKPVCRTHRFFSEIGGYQRTEGLRIWHHLCATCFALEQFSRKATDEITREERLAFFSTPQGHELVGEWDLMVLHDAHPPREDTVEDDA